MRMKKRMLAAALLFMLAIIFAACTKDKESTQRHQMRMETDNGG